MIYCMYILIYSSFINWKQGVSEVFQIKILICKYILVIFKIWEKEGNIIFISKNVFINWKNLLSISAKSNHSYNHVKIT